jgi:uncharacterized protein
MPFLIDGHNLIPKVGLRLDSVDDELELLDLLQEYTRLSGAKLEVFFDGAPPGHAATRKLGRIAAIFVGQESSADAAIGRRLRQLGPDARNWTVVSSDRAVQRAAAAVRASRRTSEEFSAELQQRRSGARLSGPKRLASEREGKLTDEQVRDWLELFRKRQT